MLEDNDRYSSQSAFQMAIENIPAVTKSIKDSGFFYSFDSSAYGEPNI